MCARWCYPGVVLTLDSCWGDERLSSWEAFHNIRDSIIAREVIRVVRFLSCSSRFGSWVCVCILSLFDMSSHRPRAGGSTTTTRYVVGGLGVGEVVDGELRVGSYVLGCEDGNTFFTLHLPFLVLAVGLARVVDKSSS
jgi:hypothetical protein